MVDPTIARRTVSRYRLYLAGALLIVVAVVSYYFMNIAPNNHSTNSLKAKQHLKAAKHAKLWKQNKFISNNDLKLDGTQQRNYPNRLSETLKPQRKEPVQDNVPGISFNDKMYGFSDSPPITEMTRKASKNERLNVWRITNESRFYGPMSDYSDYFHGMKRLVHLDLKGAPPNKLYLQKLFPLFRKFGATGVIIEYEDMFPYKGRFVSIAAKNSYTEEDIKEILGYAAMSELDVIPLIPTFGHLEFLLKHEEFRMMRDLDSSPLVITPALDSTYVILMEMIKQVMQLHPKSSYIHIGAGGVTEVGVGLSASLLNKGKTREDIILEHILKVSRMVKEKLDKQPIVWDDLLRNIDAKKLQQSQLGQYVQPMVLSTMTNPAETLTSDLWSKYRTTFRFMWVASSFKGSTGSGRVMTDAVYHLKNHLNWIRLIEAIGPGAGDQEQAVNILGIGITGRQRYSHFGTLCELLPAGIPSLAISLKVMQLGGFNESIHRLVSKQLQCEKPVKLDLLKKYRDNDGCMFPGSSVYYKLRTLWGKLQTYSAVKENINSFASEINYKHQFFNPNELKRINASLVMLNVSLSAMAGFMRHEISTYFDSMTANEWVEINIKQTVQEISQEITEIAEFSKRKTWAARPGYDTSVSGQKVKVDGSDKQKTEVVKQPDQGMKKETYMRKLSPLQQMMKIRSRFNQANLEQTKQRDMSGKQKEMLTKFLNPNRDSNMLAGMGQPGIGQVDAGKNKDAMDVERKMKEMGAKLGMEGANRGMNKDGGVLGRKTSEIGGKVVMEGLNRDINEGSSDMGRKMTGMAQKLGMEGVSRVLTKDGTSIERKMSEMGGKVEKGTVNKGLYQDGTEMGRIMSDTAGKFGMGTVNEGINRNSANIVRKMTGMERKSGMEGVNRELTKDGTGIERKMSELGRKVERETVDEGINKDLLGMRRKMSQMEGKPGIGAVKEGIRKEDANIERKASETFGKSRSSGVDGRVI